MKLQAFFDFLRSPGNKQWIYDYLRNLYSAHLPVFIEQKNREPFKVEGYRMACMI